MTENEAALLEALKIVTESLRAEMQATYRNQDGVVPPNQQLRYERDMKVVWDADALIRSVEAQP